MRRTSAFGITGLVVGAMALAGCGTDTPSTDGSNGGDPVAVVTTTPLGSIVNDIVTCNDTSAVTIMGPGDDPHEFTPSSQQITQMAKADLVIINGLGLESNLEKAIDSARTEGATVYEVAPNVDPIPFAGHAGHDHGDEGDDHEHEGDEHADDEHSHDEHADEGDDHEHSTHDGHDHGDEDPHVHLDAGRMSKAAELIGAKLAETTGDDKYIECGEEVAAELAQVDEEIKQILEPIPAEQRVIITDHDAFGYFAEAYDFEVAGVVMPGGSTDGEASSAHLAELVEVIEERNISTIFSNSAVNPQLVEALAAETGRDVEVVQLYVGSVGPDGSGAEDYAGMMTTNASLITEALK